MGIFPERDTARQRKLDINGQIKTDTERKTKRDRERKSSLKLSLSSRKRERYKQTHRERECYRKNPSLKHKLSLYTNTE